VTETVRTLPVRSWGTAVESTAWQDDSLWLAGNEACGPAGEPTSRICLRVIEVRTDTFEVHQDITYGADDASYSHPALRPDRDGNLYVVFNSITSTEPLSVRVTGRAATDPLNTLQPSVVLRAGRGNPVGTRFGDFSGAAVDPADPTRVWVAGEYLRSITLSGDSADWGTVIAQLRIGGAPFVASFTSPADGAFVNGIVTIGVSETGGTPPFTWMLRIDGGNTDVFTTSGTTPTASFGWDTSRMMRGRHYLFVEAQDATGRKAAGAAHDRRRRSTERFVHEPGRGRDRQTAPSPSR